MSTMTVPTMNSTANKQTITRAIFEHAAHISQVQNIDELVMLNANFARDLAEADRCSLWLIDEKTGQLWTKVAHGVDPIRIPVGAGLVGAAIFQDEVILVNDTSREPRLLRTVDASSGYRTEQVLCVPMRADGRVIGALQLLNKATGFTEEDAGLCGLLAHFAGSAIESERLRQEADRARLMQHELDLAYDVQARLLPQGSPVIKGIECMGFCRPARSVGGDYYDLLPFEDGSFAFTLGDVSGKGIPAAVMMASIQTLLRSLLEHGRDNLAAVIVELNRALYASSTPERYSTLFCGVISADRSTLTYVNAGHVQPILLRRTEEPAGAIVELLGDGLPVGMLPGSMYEHSTIALQPGDLIVVVSDGIVESRNNEGEFWDDDAVKQCVREHSTTPAKDLPATLCSCADAFASGAEQYDDMTVVALRLGD
jgi:sigma-B regulation protein RsbU (phosphoserine phosphatase)